MTLTLCIKWCTSADSGCELLAGKWIYCKTLKPVYSQFYPPTLPDSKHSEDDCSHNGRKYILRGDWLLCVDEGIIYLRYQKTFNQLQHSYVTGSCCLLDDKKDYPDTTWRNVAIRDFCGVIIIQACVDLRLTELRSFVSTAEVSHEKCGKKNVLEMAKPGRVRLLRRWAWSWSIAVPLLSV